MDYLASAFEHGQHLSIMLLKAPLFNRVKGRGDLKGLHLVHPHLGPPPSKGEEIIGEISNTFG